jgi:hypothetical protein
MDEGDAEIAAALAVSDDAVKKIWRRIYERVAAVDPELLGGATDPSELTRGKEKRRRLVRHLRYHLEELRPFTVTPTRRTRTSSPGRPRGRAGHRPHDSR